MVEETAREHSSSHGTGTSTWAKTRTREYLWYYLVSSLWLIPAWIAFKDNNYRAAAVWTFLALTLPLVRGLEQLYRERARRKRQAAAPTPPVREP